MFEFYASAPISYCFLCETIKDKVIIDDKLQSLIMNERAIICPNLLEANPFVQKMLSKA